MASEIQLDHRVQRTFQEGQFCGSVMTIVVCILLEPSCGFLGDAPLPKKPQEGSTRGASPHEVLVCGFNGYTNYTTQHNCVIIVWKVEKR